MKLSNYDCLNVLTRDQIITALEKLILEGYTVFIDEYAPTEVLLEYYKEVLKVLDSEF